MSAIRPPDRADRRIDEQNARGHGRTLRRIDLADEKSVDTEGEDEQHQTEEATLRFE